MAVSYIHGNPCYGTILLWSATEHSIADPGIPDVHVLRASHDVLKVEVLPADGPYQFLPVCCVSFALEQKVGYHFFLSSFFRLALLTKLGLGSVDSVEIDVERKMPAADLKKSAGLKACYLVLTLAETVEGERGVN